MADWQKYKDGDAIAGKLVKIAGEKSQYNMARSLYDGKSYNLPGGLTGSVEDKSPFRMTFRMFEGYNRNIWDAISPKWENNMIVVFFDPSRFRGLYFKDS